MLSKIILYYGILTWNSSSWIIRWAVTSKGQTRISGLFVFVLGIFLLAVWQTCLPRKGGNLEEEIGVAVNPQGHQDGSGCVKQVSCQHRPENIIWDTKRSCGTRMEEPPDMSPLALGGETESKTEDCVIIACFTLFSSWRQVNWNVFLSTSTPEE